MEDNKIVGRRRECSVLSRLMKSNESEFVVVYGRRRVGKTFFINRYFNDDFAFKLTGLAEKNKEMQLQNFADALLRFTKTQFTVPKTWFEAFNRLRNMLENKKSDKKKVVFIDELSFMDTPRSGLITALEHFWNDWASTRNDIILIICCSATSWISNKILKNHGGLHNRVTCRLYIKPFTLAETKEYIRYKGLQMEEKEIAECYMIMGGIPYYLKHLQKGKSLAQNIDSIFFRRKEGLDGEFENLYASLLKNSENYVKVIEALSSKNKGLTRKELLEKTGLIDNGHFAQILSDLDDCDFIRKYRGYGKNERQSLYQLTDFYSFFYFKFIKKYKSTDKEFWIHQINTPSYNAWAGYAFEQLCLYHYSRIENTLGISGIQTEIFAWNGQHAQIDLVIKRADKVINVCEIKFCESEFVITKKYRDEIVNKINAFRRENKIRWAIHLVMITANGLYPTEYSSLVQNEVFLSDLF